MSFNSSIRKYTVVLFVVASIDSHIRRFTVLILALNALKSTDVYGHVRVFDPHIYGDYVRDCRRYEIITRKRYSVGLADSAARGIVAR